MRNNGFQVVSLKQSPETLPVLSVQDGLLFLWTNGFCFVGFYLSALLEEQGPSAEDPHGGHQEGFSLPLREQHPQAAEALRRFQTHRC